MKNSGGARTTPCWNSQIDMRSADAEEYIYKIVDLTAKAASKDTRIWLLESELGRLRAANDRFVQELSTKDAAAAAEERSVAEISTREWAELKRELQEQRDLVLQLSFEHGSTLKDALKQVDKLHKELTDALRSVANAESRAAVAEDSDSGDGDVSSSTEKMLAKFRDEIEKLREEAQSSKLQADEVKRSLEDEIRSLKERVNELDSECKLKTEEVISATAGKEEALAGVLSEIASVKDDYSGKEEPLLDEQIQVELRDTVDAADEKLDKPSDSMLSDDQLRDQTAQDIQRIVAESGGEREEGELVADFADNDGDNNTSNETGGPGNAEFQGEQSAEPEKSPSTEPLGYVYVSIFVLVDYISWTMLLHLFSACICFYFCFSELHFLDYVASFMLAIEW